MNRLWRSLKQAAVIAILLASLPLALPSVSIVVFVGLVLLLQVCCGALGLAFLKGLATSSWSCKSKSHGFLVLEKSRIFVEGDDDLRDLVGGLAVEPTHRSNPSICEGCRQEHEERIEEREEHNQQDARDILCAMDLEIPPPPDQCQSCREEDIPKKPKEDSLASFIGGKECIETVDHDVAVNGVKDDHGAHDDDVTHVDVSLAVEIVKYEQSSRSTLSTSTTGSSMFSPRSVCGMEMEISEPSSSSVSSEEITPKGCCCLSHFESPTMVRSSSSSTSSVGDNMSMSGNTLLDCGMAKKMVEKSLCIENFMKSLQGAADVGDNQFAQLLRFWRAKEQGIDFLPRKNLFGPTGVALEY